MRVNPLDLDDIYTALVEAKHYDSLWNRFIKILTACDIDLISYHHITPLGSSGDNHGRIDILSHGYPRAWDNHYREQKFHHHDPIFNMSYKALRPVKWSDALNQTDLTAEQKTFISEYKEWMKGDGYSIPAFGPSGQTACFGIGNTATIAEWDNVFLRRIEWICWQFHLSYSAMRLKEFSSTFSLTDQDRDILQQWGLNKNIAIIAETTGETPKDVQTIIHNIMKKMNVTDSQSLMIRGIHLGLIKPKSE